MMEVHISGPKLMSSVVVPKLKKSRYLFLRRTSGGGHIYLLLDDSQVEQFKQEFQRIKEEYETFEKEHGRNGTIGYTVREMPKDVHKFFAELRKYIDLDYRVVKDTVEVAVVPRRVGQFIGKRGFKVKAIGRHLRKRVKVFKAVKKSGVGYNYFAGYRDPARAYHITQGYIAPWEVKE